MKIAGMELVVVAFERHCEIVSQRVDYDNNSLLKCFGMPASFLKGPRWFCAKDFVKRQNVAFRLTVEDMSSQKEPFRKEEDPNKMNNTV